MRNYDVLEEVPSGPMGRIKGHALRWNNADDGYDYNWTCDCGYKPWRFPFSRVNARMQHNRHKYLLKNDYPHNGFESHLRGKGLECRCWCGAILDIDLTDGDASVHDVISRGMRKHRRALARHVRSRS